MKTISLTVPMDYNALTRASDMLHGMAIDLKHEGAPVTASAEAERKVQNALVEEAHVGPNEGASTTAVETEAPAPAPVVTAEPEAAAVFADPNVATVANATEQPAALAPAEPVESVTTAATATNAVDLDGEGLPWDARIHASSKAKLAKAPNGWKKKRGVEAAIVAQVEAELRAAMQAGPANPVVTQPAPAPVETATPAPAPAAQVAQPAAAVGITTFPALMGAITSNGIDQATVLAAVNKQGLQALPLLAARPDLIPAVALELGV